MFEGRHRRAAWSEQRHLKATARFRAEQTIDRPHGFQGHALDTRLSLREEPAIDEDLRHQ